MLDNPRTRDYQYGLNPGRAPEASQQTELD
jgi:hypothetical protein